MAGRPKGSRSLKNMLRADLVCQEDGVHPIREVVRIARKAEKDGELHLASNNWQFIQEFCQAKPKPIEADDDELSDNEEGNVYDDATIDAILDS